MMIRMSVPNPMYTGLPPFSGGRTHSFPAYAGGKPWRQWRKGRVASDAWNSVYGGARNFSRDDAMAPGRTWGRP